MTSTKLSLTALLLLLLSVSACVTGKTDHPPLKTVDKVDLERYLGKWYEIAAIPQSFQKGCTATTAEYSRVEGKDYIRVKNICRLGTPEGREKVAEAKAWVVDEETNAKLEVQFFWPFRGDYWIIELGPDYRYAVVGHPSRDYLWILSRTPHMDEAVLKDLMQRIESEHDYDLAKIVKTVQPDSGKLTH